MFLTAPCASQGGSSMSQRRLRGGPAVLAVLAISVASGTCLADDPLARDFMGAGMHAYHAGDWQRSAEDLTAAINAGSRDPRAYYFRALALLQQGREDEAIADMQQGAMFESSGPGGTVIARSLERIQGPHRRMLERYRRRALIEQQALDRRRIEQRYTDSIDRSPELLRQRRPTSIREPLPKPATVTPATPVEPAPAVPPAADMLWESDDPSTIPPATTPAVPSEPDISDDPFAIPGESEMPADSDDPFAVPPSNGRGAPPPPAGGDDPFGPPAGQQPTPPADAPGNGELFDDPFGESSSGAGRPVSSDNVADQVDEQMESAAAEVDDTLDQIDGQQERGAAEFGDVFDQVDEQREREAAAGEGGSVAEPIDE